ncbi:hypothetical protein KCU65_g5666, partial [Aureobasidium melanogenum]
MTTAHFLPSWTSVTLRSSPGSFKTSWLWLSSDDPPVHQIDMEHWRFNQPQTVNLIKIEAGVDVRTTSMLRNIPNRVDFEDLKIFLDATSEGHYDFSFLCISHSSLLIKAFVLLKFFCCGEEKETPLAISSPTDFKRVNVELPGLTEHERALINSHPVPVTYPLHSGDTQNAARLDRAVAHGRAMSESIRSVTATVILTVGAKGSGYSALANESSSMMQLLNFEAADSSEVKQLLPHYPDGVKTNSSIETAMASCEEDDDGARSFMINK